MCIRDSLPEVSLVAILDADKEGFLRSSTALIQTIGRAARHVSGQVIMYADKMTNSMKFAISETDRRRAKQKAYNEEHHIEPIGIIKEIHDITERLTLSAAVAESRGEYSTGRKEAGLPHKEIQRIISELETQMKASSKDLQFERAAVLRDQIYELRGLLAE